MTHPLVFCNDCTQIHSELNNSKNMQFDSTRLILHEKGEARRVVRSLAVNTEHINLTYSWMSIQLETLRPNSMKKYGSEDNERIPSSYGEDDPHCFVFVHARRLLSCADFLLLSNALRRSSEPEPSRS